MRYALALFTLVFSLSALAVPCDCDVMVFSPMSGPHDLGPSTLASYQLEEFNSYSKRDQSSCRQLCREEFREEMSVERLRALLLTHSSRLIDNRVVGFNCTGPTTLKYPVRVKARLGSMSLGNVFDFMQVVNHEEQCF